LWFGFHGRRRDGGNDQKEGNQSEHRGGETAQVP
jgi:hypothetical protein